MVRFGAKYQHLAAQVECRCCSPAVQLASRRLDSFSRRSFLAGLGAAVVGSAVGGAQAQGQAQGAGGTIAFRNANVFDGRSGNLQKGVQVLVENGLIVAVDAANNPAPAGASVIDCGGRVLMPGLIDAHWHAIFAATPLNILLTGDPGIIFAGATAEAERTLLRGFTTVRDLGGPTFSFKQAIDSGVIPGPRIYPSGPMITTSGGHGDMRMPHEIPRNGNQLSLSEKTGGVAIADDPGEVRMRVREQLLHGASQIKIVGSGGVSSPRSPLDIATFSETELRAAVETARDWNTYVTVHAYKSDAVQRAIAAGAKCIEHAQLIDEATARQLAEKGVWLSTQPFLTAADSSAQSGPGVARALQIFDGTPRLYGYARKYGIRTAWGSDMLFSPERAPRQSVMLTHLANWFTNAEILQMATSGNAELMALSGPRNPYPGKLGLIEKGAYADVLVVDGDPLADIRLLEQPEKNLAVVMKHGRIYRNRLPTG